MMQLNDLVSRGQLSKEITLNDRLPSYVSVPCHLMASFHVEAKDNYYLMNLNVSGDLTISCQRCMHEFTFPYENQTEIAICPTEERAEELLERYETIVSVKGQVDLEDLIIDELHLYAPLFHPLNDDCDQEINQFLSVKSGAY